ncbi:MAG: DUF4115 domain-containing protein [Gaiellaceae bacterium]
MPETAFERVFFIGGIIAIAALVAVIAWETQTSGPKTNIAGARTGATATHVTESTPTTTAVLPTTATTVTSTPAAPTTSNPPESIRLRLTARADTWLSVRRGSATGPLLYEGTLTAGASRSFSGDAFRVRFGAAANVSAELDGEPLHLPGGTYSATITTAGVGDRSA